MSSEDYNRRLEEGKKIINALRKDLKYREEQEKRGQTTYAVDADIKGQFTQLDEVVEKVETIFNNFKANPKDFGLTNKEIEKRQQQYEQIANERTNLKRQYDSYFQKKSTKDLIGDQPAPSNKPVFSNMNSKQLLQHKENQQKQQQQVLDQLINVVKNTKQGGKAIGKQLQEQDGMLDELDKGIDDNTQNMGRVRRNMMKLMEQSSNWCLIFVIILELAGIFCTIFLWK